MPSGYPYPMYPGGPSGGISSASGGSPDRRPNQYPTAAPLPAHYPLPGGSQQQQYPSASHSNPLTGTSSAAGHVPPPANPWGFPNPQHSLQHPPPRNVAPETHRAPPAPPASRPENMSSLTNYCVKVKDQFVLPPSVPPANLETVKQCSHNLTTTLEDEILSDAEARRLEASSNSPDPGGTPGAASADLLGGLSALDVGDGSGAVPLPCVDSQSIAVDLHTQLNVGSAVAIRLALAKYIAEDGELISSFCENFERCKEVAAEASDLEIAAALFVTDEKQEQWRQQAMHVLMPNV